MEKRAIHLVVMAAGMSRRFGALKQMQAVGPDGQTLIDYSLEYARAAGFDGFHILTRPELRQQLLGSLESKWQDRLQIGYVEQRQPEHRSKPWGTGQAMLLALEAVQGWVVLINADDYYGPHCFKVMADHLRQVQHGDGLELGVVGYPIATTLPTEGEVHRALLREGADGYLQAVEETLNIDRKRLDSFPQDQKVSMNFWGLPTEMAPAVADMFVDFQKGCEARQDQPEFLIPTVVNDLIQRQEVAVKVLGTHEPWIGLTHSSDLDATRAFMREASRIK